MRHQQSPPNPRRVDALSTAYKTGSETRATTTPLKQSTSRRAPANNITYQQIQCETPQVRASFGASHLDLHINVMSLVDHFERLSASPSTNCDNFNVPPFQSTHDSRLDLYSSFNRNDSSPPANAPPPPPPPPEKSPLKRPESWSSINQPIPNQMKALRDNHRQDIRRSQHQNCEQQKEQQPRQNRHQRRQRVPRYLSTQQRTQAESTPFQPRLHPSSSQMLSTPPCASLHAQDHEFSDQLMADDYRSTSSASSFEFNLDSRRMASVQMKVLEEGCLESHQWQSASYTSPPPSPRLHRSIDSAKFSPTPSSLIPPELSSLHSVPSAPLPRLLPKQISESSSYTTSVPTVIKSLRGKSRPSPSARALSALAPPQSDPIEGSIRHQSALDSGRAQKVTKINCEPSNPASAQTSEEAQANRTANDHVRFALNIEDDRNVLDANARGNNNKVPKQRERKLFGLSTEMLKRLGQKITRKSAK